MKPDYGFLSKRNIVTARTIFILIEYRLWQSRNKKGGSLFPFSHVIPAFLFVIPVKIGIQSFPFHPMTNNFFFKKEGFCKILSNIKLCALINQNDKTTNRNTKEMFILSNRAVLDEINKFTELQL
ncbi:MAG: hypothetical protein ACTSWR_08715 [Candidatus Helarchaeota archaeon]